MLFEILVIIILFAIICLLSCIYTEQKEYNRSIRAGIVGLIDGILDILTKEKERLEKLAEEQEGEAKKK